MLNTIHKCEYLAIHNQQLTREISACGKGQQWLQALTLFSTMGQWYLAPDVVSYKHCVSACEGRQRLQALTLFSEMRQRYLVPYVTAYSAASSACETDQQWLQVLTLFRDGAA